MTTFIDSVTLFAAAGKGGDGCVSVKREKFKPLGGPDGGNGGRGGDIILVVDSSVTTLLDFHHSPHRKATSGHQGFGDRKDGVSGEDLIMAVPNGTVIYDEDGKQIADLIGIGTTFLAARGGHGGLGNLALASSKRRAPGFALLGEPGEERRLTLQLKSVADIALVGFPSAGKSSLIAAISAARPKIADYPFTTLHPNLGVVQAEQTRYVIADVPGLIEGASEGKGLGLQFLRHVERCSALLHVIDCATLEPMRDPITDLDKILHELNAYQVPDGELPLTQRPQLVALNKADVPEARELAEFVKPELEARGYRVFIVSAATREGLRELNFALAQLVEQERKTRAAIAPVLPRITLMQSRRDESKFTVTKEMSHEGEFFRIVGVKPERWVAQTQFGNDEAVGYLGDRLFKIGVEEALRLKEAGKADEVIVVSIGPAAAAETLRTGLAMGADRGILVKCDTLVEPLAVAKIIKGVVEAEGPGLVILGKQAIDDDSNQTGQMLAALTGRPQGTFASKVEIAGDSAKVQRYIANCNAMGIEVMPPDVNASGIDFTPVGDRILFGLSAVRNLGDGAIRQLIECRLADGPFASLAELCDRIPGQQLNRRAMEALIHSGALDALEPRANRAQLMADLDLVVDWASSRAKDRASGQGNLFDLLAAADAGSPDGSGPADLSTAPKAAPVRDYPPTEKLRLEKELVGFYLSDHPLKQLHKQVKLLSPIALGQLEEQPDKAKVSAVVMVSELRQVNTRKGDRMAVLQLEDLTGSCEAVVFPKSYARLADHLMVDSRLLVWASVDRRDDRIQLIVDDCRSIDDLQLLMVDLQIGRAHV